MNSHRIRALPRFKLTILFLLSMGGCADADAAASNAVLSKLPSNALQEITPVGYKIDDVITLPKVAGTPRQYLFGLSDVVADPDGSTEIPEKLPMIMLVKAGRKLLVLDRAPLHPQGIDATPSSHSGNTPNYLTSISRANVGGRSELFLVVSMDFVGGSDSYHFFDFYRVRDGKLQLMKNFAHGRMERTYFTIYQNAIYDGRLHCERGKKHGNAYKYTCRIDVTKYVYDGDTVREMGTQKLRERQGNRYLPDKYWFVSVSNALRKKEIFN